MLELLVSQKQQEAHLNLRQEAQALNSQMAQSQQIGLAEAALHRPEAVVVQGPSRTAHAYTSSAGQRGK